MRSIERILDIAENCWRHTGIDELGLLSLSTADYPELKGWDDIPDCNMAVLRGVYAYGFENPSPIQQKAIPPMVDRRDMIAQAQSGTGKTGAFTVGTLNIIDTSKKTTQAIVMAPTREFLIRLWRM